MLTLIKIFLESTRQALGALTGNKLRTFLSLLGITIGIFCIIAIKSAVDSLEDNILSGFKELGSDVVYVDKFPWNNDANENYWKYIKRPNPDFHDFEILSERSQLGELFALSVEVGGKTVKYKSSSVSDIGIVGATFQYKDIYDLKLGDGRMFTVLEDNQGSNKAVIGFKIAESLFGTINPIGKHVKLFGQKYQVIGVLESEGDSDFNFITYDEAILLTYNNIKRYIDISEKSPVWKRLAVKGKPGIKNRDLKGEMASLLRRSRGLRPMEKDNFALNEMTAIVTAIEGVMTALNWAGFIIGVFSLIIGMFSVANIMFVSVKERTNIIGIKKALGAKHYMILLEFLVESVILCLIGGAIGLLFVWGLLTAVTHAANFPMSLSFGNILLGVIVSVLVGILSGIIPASIASKLDPVVAMRG